eukprot:TRINITY_DN13300_c0_g1_i1.p1 TRINITY_DN13300_c0_g1~~TRINITY_DN13300_c0_g1_i1.p1  ORF type:complete len:711 (-),score=82.76 TRINITY_DN13300_c0_g1_i1:211-2343(-)
MDPVNPWAKDITEARSLRDARRQKRSSSGPNPAEITSWKRAIAAFCRTPDWRDFADICDAFCELLTYNINPVYCALCFGKIGKGISSHMLAESIYTFLLRLSPGAANEFIAFGVKKVKSKHQLSKFAFCKHVRPPSVISCEDRFSWNGENDFAKKMLSAAGFIVHLHEVIRGKRPLASVKYGKWLAHCIVSHAYRVMLNDDEPPSTWSQSGPTVCATLAVFVQKLRSFLLDQQLASPFGVRIWISGQHVQNGNLLQLTVPYQTFGLRRMPATQQFECFAVFGFAGVYFECFDVANNVDMQQVVNDELAHSIEVDPGAAGSAGAAGPADAVAAHTAIWSHEVLDQGEMTVTSAAVAQLALPPWLEAPVTSYTTKVAGYAISRIILDDIGVIAPVDNPDQAPPEFQMQYVNIHVLPEGFVVSDDDILTVPHDFGWKILFQENLNGMIMWLLRQDSKRNDLIIVFCCPPPTNIPADVVGVAPRRAVCARMVHVKTPDYLLEFHEVHTKPRLALYSWPLCPANDRLRMHNMQAFERDAAQFVREWILSDLVAGALGPNIDLYDLLWKTEPVQALLAVASPAGDTDGRVMWRRAAAYNAFRSPRAIDAAERAFQLLARSKERRSACLCAADAYAYAGDRVNARRWGLAAVNLDADLAEYIMPDIDHTCALCGSPAIKQCSRCCRLLFCSPECLEEAWPNHRAECVKYKLYPEDFQ